MNKTILITGASSGIGKATAKFFAAKGWNVVATMRSLEEGKDFPDMDNVLAARLDVQDGASIDEAIKAGIERFGTIDVLLNNAGYSLTGIFEATSREKVLDEFGVNVFGVMDVTRAMLPYFRQNKAGMIINMSSRAGLVGMPLNSLYCAAKYAVEGFSEALAYELASQNIIVKLIEPSGGVTNTDFGKRVTEERAVMAQIGEYADFLARTGKVYAGMTASRTMSADNVAEAIYGATTDGTTQLRYFIGEDVGGFAKAKREMSESDYVEFMRGYFSR